MSDPSGSDGQLQLEHINAQPSTTILDLGTFEQQPYSLDAELIHWALSQAEKEEGTIAIAQGQQGSDQSTGGSAVTINIGNQDAFHGWRAATEGQLDYLDERRPFVSGLAAAERHRASKDSPDSNISLPVPQVAKAAVGGGGCGASLVTKTATVRTTLINSPKRAPQQTRAAPAQESERRTSDPESTRPGAMSSGTRALHKSEDEWSSNRDPSPYGNMSKNDTAEEELQTARQVDANGSKTSLLRSRQVGAFSELGTSLPAEKGFPIQIGSELFRLSGASIMSDAPSYFSKFFEEQLRNSEDGSGSVKILYIDRDPITFQDIALHLQGYRLLPRDGYHFVKLFADAQFYSLPKLIKQLYEAEYFIRIGERDFRISKDIFTSPGNTPNYFSLGFPMFAPSSGEVFPGLNSEGLFRPPSIEAPALLGRSADTFADILHLLRGYPLQMRSPEHRKELLRDCRYYHLRGLEQQLIKHAISFNAGRQKTEILIGLEDVRQSGVSFQNDAGPADRSPLAGWVGYARPFVDEGPYDLVLEIGEEAARIDVCSMRAEFYGQAKARITSLFQVVANKMNLPTIAPLGLMMSTGGVDAQPVSPGNTPLSDDLVKVAIGRDAHVLLDGEEFNADELSSSSLASPIPAAAAEDIAGAPSIVAAATPEGGGAGSMHLLRRTSRSPGGQQPPPRKRARRSSLDEFGEWVVQRAQWRLRVQPRSYQMTAASPAGTSMEIVMVAVKLDAISGQRGRNAKRQFLG